MGKISLVSDTINKEDIKALTDWLNQNPTPRLTKGELTVQLEKEWAEIIGTKYSVFVNSGSSAILLLLAALKETKKYSNKIIVPALSWATDVSSPMLLGYEPILCDCNLHDLSCDLNQLEELFSYHTSDKPTLFISVAPLGLVPDMDKILELCEKYNFVLLEDICESMGSKYKGKMLGSFGLASTFSMYYGHLLSCIEGGLINTNDDELYNLLLAMRSHGWDRDENIEEQNKLRNEWNISDFQALYTFYYPGMNVRSTDLQAFIGLRMFKRLDQYCKIRNKNYYLYQSYIKNNKLQLSDNSNSFIASFAYPMVHEKRDIIVKKLMENNIEVRPLIAGNMVNQPFWKKVYGKNKRILENAEIIDKYGFYLPNHQDLIDKSIQFITKIINDCI